MPSSIPHKLAALLVVGVSARIALDDSYRGLLRAGRRAGRHRDRQCARLRGGAAARRGAGRDRPRQDGVLQQRQPRVPDAADADAGAAGGRAGRSTATAAAASREAPGDGPPEQPAAAEAGQHAARLLAHRGRPRRGALRADRPGAPHDASWPASSARRSSAPASASWSTVRRCRQPVYVDRDMWEKIVLNLLSNAFKFTFEGEIAVRAATRRRARRADASATPASASRRSELPQLFERFHRVARRARARTHEGTGIGLALVQELVRLHGGTVAVESARRRGHHLHGDDSRRRRRTCRRTRRRRPRARSTPLGASPVRRGGAALAARR